jgi:hypothetical protein
VLRDSGLARIAANGNIAEVAALAVEAAHQPWNRDNAIRFILDNHTWDRRAQVYDALLRNHGL